MIRRERIIWAMFLALGLGGHAAAGTLYRCAGGPADPVSYGSHPVAGMKCKAISYASAPTPRTHAALAAVPAPEPAAGALGGPDAQAAATPIEPAPSTVDSVAIPVAPGAPALSPEAALLRQRAQIASANAAGAPPPLAGRRGEPKVIHKTMYRYTDANGVDHIEDEIHKPSGVHATVVDSQTQTCSDGVHCQVVGRDRDGPYAYANIISCYACGLLPGVNFGRLALNTTAYAAEISTASRAYGVDEWLIRAIIHAESDFNPNALSYKGAQGLMQLMPGTASRFGVQNPFAAADNISGGVQYLSFLSKRYNGDVRLIAAAYNAGEANVDRYGGVPPFAETLRYVDRVGTLAERYRGAK